MSRKQSQTMSSCYVMPLLNGGPLDDQIQFSDTAVSALNVEGGSRFNFTFNTVYKNQHEYAKSAYNTSLAPIVRQVIAGDSCVALYGGVPSHKLSNYLLSQTVMQGLISQAASQLLHSVNMHEKTGSVTFSWYRIDCVMPEVVTDVLKAASSTAQGLVTSKQTTTETSSLMLREAGKGRGMIVPGLWEVEIANGNDIEAVIQHVAKMVPSADHSNGSGHTVMVLTCKNPSATKQTHGAPEKSGALGDPPGVGRLTFVMLGALQSSTGPYPWVDQVHALAGWLAARRPSPPFHKSRLLLLLRDAFLHKQAMSGLLLLAPALEDRAANAQWLRVLQAICGAPSVAHNSSFSEPAAETVKRSMSTGRLGLRPPATPVAVSLTPSGPSFRTPSLRADDADAGLLDFSPIPRPPPTAANAPHRVQAPPAPQTVVRSASLSVTGDYASVGGTETNHYVDDLGVRETEAALTIALEASRSEAQALRIAYSYATEKHAEVKTVYDQLVAQLQEEGSMLSRRDKDRFKQAMKDLKDYEIYKQVMEAAMVRMQAELEAYAKENQELKVAKASEERSAAKHRVSTDKSQKELTALAKRLQLLEPRLAMEEKKSKQMSRERDAAVAALAQSQGQLASKVAQLQEQLTQRQKDVEDARARTKTWEDKFRAAEAEKDALMASHAGETAKLRSAHSKALETLMTYQEENDVLRATVLDLTGKDFPRAAGAKARKDSTDSVSSVASQNTSASGKRPAV